MDSEATAIRLGWDTWSQVCSFANVGHIQEGKSEGCYLGPNGYPRTGHELSDKMGLLIPSTQGLIIASEGDWLVKDKAGNLQPIKAGTCLGYENGI